MKELIKVIINQYARITQGKTVKTKSFEEYFTKSNEKY